MVKLRPLQLLTVVVDMIQHKYSITGGGGTGATVRAQVLDAKRQWVKVDRLYKDGLGDDDSAGKSRIDNTGKGSIVINDVVARGARISRIVPKILAQT